MKQKRKIGELSTEHNYSINDKVELTWLGDIRHGIIIDLTNSLTADYTKIATYKIKDIHDGTVYPCAGINGNIKICNILRKL